MVAEHGDRIVGFMLHDRSRGRVDLTNLAVHPDHRRRTIGTQLVLRLKGKLTPDRPLAAVVVRDDNLPAQLFFRGAGFRATRVLRGAFAPAGDGYLMEYVLPAAVDLNDPRR